MKKAFLLIILMSASVYGLFAQDVIVLRDATEIEAKVMTVGIDEISYKKWNFQDGPTYQLPKKDVFFIKYENGDKDVFNDVSEASNSSQDAQNERVKGKYIHRTLFNVYGELGCDFLSAEAGPTIGFTLGARIYDYVFLGMHVGADFLFVSSKQYSSFGAFEGILIPIMANVRTFIPVNANFSPFAEISLGPNVMIAKYYYGSNGNIYSSFMAGLTGRFRVGLGVEWKRLMLAMGYDCMFTAVGAVHMGYAKVGVRIGKLK